VTRCRGVGTEPEFRGAGCGFEGAKRDVGDYEEGTLGFIRIEPKIDAKTYLGMKESDVFVHRLPEPVRFGQSIIARDEIEDWLCSKVSNYRTCQDRR